MKSLKVFPGEGIPGSRSGTEHPKKTPRSVPTVMERRGREERRDRQVERRRCSERPPSTSETAPEPPQSCHRPVRGAADVCLHRAPGWLHPALVEPPRYDVGHGIRVSSPVPATGVRDTAGERPLVLDGRPVGPGLRGPPHSTSRGSPEPIALRSGSTGRSRPLPASQPRRLPLLTRGRRMQDGRRSHDFQIEPSKHDPYMPTRIHTQESTPHSQRKRLHIHSKNAPSPPSGKSPSPQ